MRPHNRGHDAGSISKCRPRFSKVRWRTLPARRSLRTSRQVL